jgi:hypothetical protein
MNVKTFIKLLQDEVKPVDRENSQIEFFVGEQEYGIESIKGFCLSPDIVIELKKVKTPLMQPARFKSEHKEMVHKKLKAIKKETKNYTKIHNCGRYDS